MKVLYIYFSIFLIFSCGKKSSSESSGLEEPSVEKPGLTQQLIVLPEVQEFFDDIDEFNRVYVKGSPINNVIFEFIEDDSDSRLEMPARGFCDKSGNTPKIYLYKADWVGSYVQTYFHRFASFYHLVGHCVFNKEHNEETFVASDRPKSFMHSDFGRWRYYPGYDGGYDFFRYVVPDLKREFFNYYGHL